MLNRILLFILFISSLSLSQNKFAFYKNGTYLQNIPVPYDILGYEIGDKPARYDDVIKYFSTLAEKSKRVKLVETGETHEMRKLFYLVVSSESNISRLDEIKSNINKISDPRITSSSESSNIANSTPAIAFMMYSIHGDELSGTDAAVQLAYQLAAGTDSVTMQILNNVVTCIDPMQNPDGRERYLAMMQQWQRNMVGSDIQSIEHVGSWPYGRTNHYLFDLNRDWFILAHPESRARVKALTEWKPQLVVDAHEQQPFSTYYFNPPREPINSNISTSIRNWWKTFAQDQAKAFDEYGWSYYTRESYDDWYPGFGSSWPYFHGAIGILYEQASTDGFPVKRPDGTVLIYREAVHHHFTSSFANLKTVAANRKKLLTDYYNEKVTVLSGNNPVKAYIIDPSVNPTRASKLIENLLFQGIEVELTEKEFISGDLKSFYNSDDKFIVRTFPKGCYIIKCDQPLTPLVNALFDFDPRMTSEFLKKERESLEKGKGTQFYEVAAWSMPMAYDLDVFSTKSLPNVNTKRVTNILLKKPGTVTSASYGYLLDYKDDKTISVLTELFKYNLKVRSSKEEFKVNSKSFSRGSLLIRLNENRNDIAPILKQIADSTGADFIGINTALSEEGPDIGGNDFVLLQKPIVGIITGSPVNTQSFGSLWYLLDCELKYPHSILSTDIFKQADLRKYNVLVFPSGNYKQHIGKEELEKLKNWISAGGTLISIGDASAFFADTTNSFSKVRLRNQVLKELNKYDEAYYREKNSFNTLIDSLFVWDNSINTKPEEDTSKTIWEELASKDEIQKLYMPRGALLNTDLNTEHWINYGLKNNVAAILYTANTFLSKSPVETPARFAEADKIRLSGLLWPEARERWAKSSYTTRESLGYGQIILFAGEPIFRSYFYGTGRMLINAILLGPGFGSNQHVPID